jgi:hypothetical protein
LLCRSQGGKFILRVEDTDVERSTKESEEAVLRDLEWMGIEWDEGESPDLKADLCHAKDWCRKRAHRYCAISFIETEQQAWGTLFADKLRRFESLQTKRTTFVIRGHLVLAVSKEYKFSGLCCSLPEIAQVFVAVFSR